MTGEEILVQAIEERPTDSFLWSAYADWLTENGQGDFADQIRGRKNGFNEADLTNLLGVRLMLGKVMKSVENGGNTLAFTAMDGTIYRFYHYQDCCESVAIEEIHGDLHDLVGLPLRMAEERISQESPEGNKEQYESATWTFYRFATAKGYVTVRWFGTSNGYYSESVDFEVVRP